MKHFLLSLVAVATLSVPASAQQTVKYIYASSSTLDLTQLCSTERPVQLNRYLFAGYNTLCLPMSLSSSQFAAATQGARLERLVAMKQEGSMLNLYFMDCTSEGLEAGVPYLIHSPLAQYMRVRNTDAEIVSDHLSQVRLADEQGNVVSFGSSWEKMSQNGRYGIPANQGADMLESVLVRTEGDRAFLPTRCGFNWDHQSATATELQIQHVQSLDELTAIHGVQSSDMRVETDYYDLSGRKLSRAQKGLVIQQGKKVLK